MDGAVMRIRNLLHAVCLFALLPASGYAATACHVDYAVENEWNTGFTASVNITNTGDAWNPTQTETDYPVLGTANGVSAQYVDDTVLSSDKEVTLAVFDVVPTTSGIVLIDGNAHQVVRVTPIPAAGTPAAYKVFCRA